MKITLAQAELGITQYVTKEICSKLTDWRKWVIPVFMGSAIPKLEKMYTDNKETLISTGFVDQDNMIEIDKVYEVFHKAAESSGDIVQNIPLLGTLRLSSHDIDLLYQILKNNSTVSTLGL